MIQLGLLGWPVSHSLSPKLQNAALAALGLVGEYKLFPVEPVYPEKIGGLLEKVRAGELTGLNVTIPYKQEVLKFLDVLSPTAESIGAVNTIYMQDSQLVGHNTDAPGFLADLKKKSGNLLDHPATALVIGAGGSARAVVNALVGMSWKVIIAARKLEQAQVLSNLIQLASPAKPVECITLDTIGLTPVLNFTQMVVNTTPLGMHPNIDITPWPPGLCYPVNAFIYDLVYNPSQTLFVKQARDTGLQAVNGLGMLIEQAALGFEIWTGKTAPRDVMYSAVGSFL